MLTKERIEEIKALTDKFIAELKIFPMNQVIAAKMDSFMWQRPEQISELCDLALSALVPADGQNEPIAWISEDGMNYLKHNACTDISPQGMRDDEQNIPLYTRLVPAVAIASTEAGEVLGLHPKTAEYLKKFTQAMAEKLRAAEQKYGYSDGWSTADWQEECHEHMHAHIAKGDPRDVANYCMFMWARGWSTGVSNKEKVNTRYCKQLAEQRDDLVEKHRRSESALTAANERIAALEAQLLRISRNDINEKLRLEDIASGRDNPMQRGS